MSNSRIAIVGIGLRYPDAATPEQLWENVLSGRQAFRRLPDQRMNRTDYFSPDRDAPDRFYSEKAAVLRDFEFDRVRYRVAGTTYRSTDTTHWLALDVASQALADAGFPDGAGLPKQAAGVVLGNSLTGEFSRANVMRLRWPYVRRTLAMALADKGWDDAAATDFLEEFEGRYKAPFPAMNEDSLAGGLSNTIAGRICNYYDLGGGGFTVDGACSSSLLSVVTAAKALLDGDIDIALAGGVDLSIDPFEVIGFARTGALATGEMKVYDRDSNGFWPGEGSGQVVLMREDDAIEHGKRIYASIAGWGVSSDGKGGITRPEASGHRLALARAYRRAGYGVDTVSYFEGHGTGTAVGDATEITALSSARRESDATAGRAALSTVKGNLGHTKAAAGVAGLIKAALAVYHQVIPPATGHHDPHPLLLDESVALYVPSGAEPWPVDRPIRAGVSAMGFGGINSHITLEQAPRAERRHGLDERTRELVVGRQDAEVLLFDAPGFAVLRERLAQVSAWVSRLAMAEMTDLAGTLAGELSGHPVRAAVVVTGPDDAERKLGRLLTVLDNGERDVCNAGDGIFAGRSSGPPRIGFLFPGQGSGRGAGGAIRRRFPVADEAFRMADLPIGGNQVATEVAQPRIVSGSLAALRVLRELGIEGASAVGHSLGELTALHWGGAMDEQQLLRLAVIRGEVMATTARGDGAMAGLAAGPAQAEELIRGEDVVIAGYNAPEQTVVSGPSWAVDRVCAAAQAHGVPATRINVSHAFHSPAVEPAAVELATRLAEFEFGNVTGAVVSTVTGDFLDPAVDLRGLIRDQVLLPVRFHEAVCALTADVDLVLEVGPGRVLAGLSEQIAPGTPVLSVDSDHRSLTPLLCAVGAAFASGARVNIGALFAGRVVRSLPLDGKMTFLANPCEEAPATEVGLTRSTDEGPAREVATGVSGVEPDDGSNSTLALLCKMAAERAELPLDTVTAETHPLDELHLSSITVGQIVNDVTRSLGRPPLAGMTSVATACLGELAAMIDELAATGPLDDGFGGEVPGVAPWVRPFAVEYVEAPAPAVEPGIGAAVRHWQVHAPDGHPLAEPIRAALAVAGVGDGVLLCLPSECDEDCLGLFLAASRAVLAAPSGTRFVVVQQDLGASGLAKSLHLEDPSTPTTIVGFADVMPTGPAAIATAVDRVLAETAATADFQEVRYDAADRRTVPVLTSMPVFAGGSGSSHLGPDDVLLVTGGGKGITAECALALAKDSGAELALLGRSDPATDPELAANLARMAAAGVRYRYERADVTTPDQIVSAVARIQAELGVVTAVLHGAGRNEPSGLFNLTEDTFRATVAPKVGGLRAVLAAVDPDRIKLLVTFGSIIGRAGLPGEAHYATANDWLSESAVRFGREHPAARVLALEWSVWSGVGMGERLSVVEVLERNGITPIPTEHGVDMLRQVLADPATPPVLVICGRTSGLVTLPLEQRELPLARFLDKPLVHYPGIELITEAELSVGSDPYLSDHLLHGDLLFPAVLGMEAMTQVAAAVTGNSGPPVLENVEFLRPVVVPPDGSTTIRLAALVTGAGAVEVVLRSAETNFGADHFRARLLLPRPDLEGDPAPGVPGLPAVPVDPSTELYGGILFQGKSFQRLVRYRRVSARQAVAEISAGDNGTWFAPFLPQRKLLADPGTRDAMMHAIQCCIPDATLLPQGIEKLHLARVADQDLDYVVLDARERAQEGDSYTYDLDVRSRSGVLVERWEGLTLRAVHRRAGTGPWVPAMLGPYLERALERILGGSRAVVVEPDPVDRSVATTAERRAQTELAVGRALGRPVRVRYRPDGKPEVDGVHVSASHGAGITVVVTGSGVLGCDIESVVERTEPDWAGLLGPDLIAVRDVLAAEAGEAANTASSRIWTALECIRKTGWTTQALTVDRVRTDGWVTLSAGRARIATWPTSIDNRPDPVVFAVLAGE